MGTQMVDAMRGDAPRYRAPGLRDWLFTPFTYIAGAPALAIGLAAILLAGLAGSFSYTHFDGVLDMHTGLVAALWVFPAEGIIAWLSLAVILYFLGRIVSKSAFRAMDLFGTQAMSRWPMLIPATAALAPAYQRFARALPQRLIAPGGASALPLMDALIFGAVVLVTIAAVVWMVALMYRSYCVCCNLKGGRAVGTFIGGLLAAEVIAKVALWLAVVR